MPAIRSSVPDKYYIGVMSGTSLDGLDLVVVDLSGQPQSLFHHHLNYDSTARAEMLALCENEHLTLESMMSADASLGQLVAKGVEQLLVKADLAPEQIRAIGSHGQTIRHCPPSDPSKPGTTLQIGDPNTIATRTGITVVGDFRRANLANGGHGAPLAPAFHAAAFSSANTRAIVNIGGMANISVLNAKEVVLGFDSGPGNVLMDAWIGAQQQKSFDEDGAWASQGAVNSELLSALNAHPFLKLAPPKSTGREQFNLHWLQEKLLNHSSTPQQDVQATLLEFTASSIKSGIDLAPGHIDEVFVCGGGAYNLALMKRLSDLMPNTAVASTEVLGIAPDLVECCAFAWFAQQTMAGNKVAIKSFTGGLQDSVLGGIFLG
ncbi:MAG: anhydro-N-acetylmuramic acid kinase [Pseudomonadales bacterium]